MIAFIASLVGQRFAKPALFALIAFTVLAIMFGVQRCTRDRTAQRQAEQTTASSEAISNAASAAIETIDNRTVTETDIDHATAVAQMEIANAPDLDTMRDAVVDSVCRQASHRSDPACALR